LFHGQAIQQAIDDMAQAGGGRVEIPAGIWYTGALELRSHVELHLAAGARLCFIRNKSNVFYPLRYTRWEGVECMNFSPFIYAAGAEDISITGQGTLDGQADEFNWMPWKFGYFGEPEQEQQRQCLFQAGA
jgi:polygalacturonase